MDSPMSVPLSSGCSSPGVRAEVRRISSCMSFRHLSFPDGPYTVVVRTAAFLYDKCQEALRLSGEPYFAGQREQGDTLRIGGCAGSGRREVILLECLVVFSSYIFTGMPGIAFPFSS